MITAGIDSSTQSTKVLVVEDGLVVRTGRASHPDGTEVHPDHWWKALEAAIAKTGGIEDCDAVSIAGQQHGLICLDADGNVLRPALLWNDTRSAQSAADLIDELGMQSWIEACGSAPVASLTVSKLRWVADNEPEVVEKLAAICLPHDWLTWKLAGHEDITDLVTDRSDASGTGYVDAATGAYRYDLLAHALRVTEDRARSLVLPRIAEPFEVVGQVAPQFGSAALGPGCGDNAGASLGLGLEPGQVSVSLGTSGVVAAVTDKPFYDPAGSVTGFMDATGRWLPLACTLNGSRIVDYVKDLLGVSYTEMDELAMTADSPACTMVPYFEGERTPNLPYERARIVGLSAAEMNRAAFSRMAFESMCCLMRGAMEKLRDGGIDAREAILIGGGAKSTVVQSFMPAILGVPVVVPEPNEYVALGAAWQALRCVDPSAQPLSVAGARQNVSDDNGAWARYKAAADEVGQ